MTSISTNPAATAPLERLLKSEENASNLIAYLAAMDPAPLALRLNIPAGNLRVARETNLTGRKGRSDFIVWDGSVPRAIIELKVAASEHGDQLARYEKWAASHSKDGETPVQCLLVDLMSFNYAASSRWQQTTLSEITGLWAESPHDQARLLAHSMKSVFDSWTAQLTSPLGAATSPVVASLAVKQASSDLMSSMWARQHQDNLIASRHFRVNGPNAATYHFLQYPNRPRHSRLSLDIRAGSSQLPSMPWNFRMGIDVHGYNGPPEEAKALALQLATDLRPYLELEPFKEFLEDTDSPQLATQLSGGRLGTGFKKSGFYQDSNVRLASQFTLDVSRLSAPGLTLLMQYALTYLHASAIAADRNAHG